LRFALQLKGMTRSVQTVQFAWILCVVFLLSACGSGPAKLATKTKIKRYESNRNVEQIVDIANSGDKRERLLALESLGRLRDPRAVKTLSDALHSSSWVERETAARSLGKLKDYLAVKPLLGALGDEAKFVSESASKSLNDTVVSLTKSRDLRYFNVLFNGLTEGDIKISDGALLALQQAVTVVAQMNDPSHHKPILAALKHEDAYIRSIAARLLGTLKHHTAIVPLIEAQNDSSKAVRDAASTAIRAINDPRAVDPLIQSLNHERRDVREEAAIALGRFTDLKTVKHLITRLTDSNPRIRYGIAVALGEAGSAHSVKPLIKTMDDQDSEVRFAAAESLGKLFWFPESEMDQARYCAALREWDKCVALGKIAIQPLLLAMTDPDSDIRKEVGDALKQLNWKPGDDRQKALFCVSQRKWDQCIALGNIAIAPLAEQLQSDSIDSNIKIRVVETMAAIKDEDAVKPLSDALQDGSESVRLAAVKALGRIKSAGIIPALMLALDNSSQQVREEASVVLQKELDSVGKAGGSKVLNPIISALGDNNRNVRVVAARLLGEMKNPKATIPLIQALEDPEADVREAAAEALKKIKDPKAIAPLVHALKSNNAHVREYVVKTLGAFQDHRAIEPMMDVINDKDPKVRTAVVEVLGDAKDPRSADLLVKALSDFDEGVREKTAESLGKIGSRQAVDALLLRVESDEVNRVRVAAGKALLSMDWKPKDEKQQGWSCVINREWSKCLDVGQAAVDALMQEMSKQDSPVKLQIARTLGGLRDPRSIPFLLQYMEESKQEKNLNDQAEVLLATTAAIKEMGKDALSHMIPVLPDWYIGKQAGIVLDSINWTPRSDEELVHFQVAKRAKGELLANWPTTEAVLLKDLESNDYARAENAAFAIIGLGKDEMVNSLVSALNRLGNLDMAEAYLNCGNDLLVKASVNWALQKGEKVHPNRRGAQPVVWGEM